MQETIEFRVPIENAVGHLPHGIGVALTTVRKIELASDDPLIPHIGRLQRQFNEAGKSFFHGWIVHRRYARSELDEAGLLHVWPRKAFEPAGEECGTVYDETLACDHVFAQTAEMEIAGYKVPPMIDTCGAGARQVTPLFLDGRRIPRKIDFSRTIAGEIVVSARVVEVFGRASLTGAEFHPVHLANKGGTPSVDHYQLNVVGPHAELDGQTRAGGDPFDHASYGRCPRGHIIGFNLLSEATVQAATVPAADVFVTRQMVSVRRGLLRPRPLLLLSPGAWRAIDGAKLKGLDVEVARLL